MTCMIGSAFPVLLQVIVTLSALCLAAVSSSAATLPHADAVVGEVQWYSVQENDSLIEVARKFDLGFNSIVAANPGIDPFIPPSGTIITIPTAWILPLVSTRPSIVINLPEYRLYFFPKEPGGDVATFPLGIGDEGADTPVGRYKVAMKLISPAWYPPKSIREKNSNVPSVVLPGPDNPLGSHALQLSSHGILIHGTNRPWGIGRRSSHGCLRLYPEDIVQLFKLVPKGTDVIIMNQAVKVAAKGERVFVEAHAYRDQEADVLEVIDLLESRGLIAKTDGGKLLRALEEGKGLPVDVTLETPAPPRPSP